MTQLKSKVRKVHMKEYNSESVTWLRNIDKK